MTGIFVNVTLATGCLVGGCNGGNATPVDAAPPGRDDSGTVVHTGCLDIRSYGGAGDDSMDNSGPLTAAYAALSADGGCIDFPGGKFRFLSSVAFNFPVGVFSVSLTGAGSDATILNWPQKGGGLVFNYSSPVHSTTHIRDLTLTTSVADGGSGIALQQSPNASPPGSSGLPAPNDVSNVRIRGDDGGGATEYWSTGIEVYGVSFIDFNGVAVYGTAAGDGIGISLSGIPPVNSTAQPLFGLYYNITASYFINLGLGLLYGTYIQGVTVNTTNFQNGKIGIKSNAGETGLGNLTITASQFNTYGPALIQALSGFQIQVTNSIFFVIANQTAIDLSQAGPTITSIVGNQFAAVDSTGTQAIAIGRNSALGLIEGNSFLGETVGVNLMSGSTGTNVQSNSYQGVGTHVIDNGLNDRVGGGSD